MRLAANTMPEPDLATAERHEVAFSGGMMGGMMGGRMMGGMMAGMMGGMMRGMQHSGIWAINGVGRDRPCAWSRC